MEIELPDGTILDAPDGADVKTVVQNYKRHAASARTREAAQSTWDEMAEPPVRTAVRGLGVRDVPVISADQLRVGMAKPFVQLGLGVKDLAGKIVVGSGLSNEDRDNLERLEVAKSGSATLGNVASELATLAAPGKVGQEVVTKGITMFPKALKYARPAMDMLTSAGVESLKAPTQETSRGERAASGAVGAGAGHAIAAVARPVLTGVRATARGAREMLDQGIPLTPGMMKGGVLQAIEQPLSTVPFLGGSIRARQREAIEAWNRQMLNKVMPEGAVTAAGRKGMQEATDAFTQSYEKLWANDVPFDLKTMHNDWGHLVAHSNSKLPKQAAKDLQDDLVRLFQDVVSTTRSGKALPGQTVSQLDDVLRGKSTAAMKKGDTDTAALYSIARNRMRAQLPAEMNQELGRLDKLYAQWSVLRRAGASASAARAGGTVTPASVLTASRGLDRTAGKGATARGQGVLQPEATQAARVIGTGQRPPDFLGGAAMAPFAAASTLTHNAPVNRLVTGQTAPQQTLRQLAMDPRMRAIIDALRHRTGPGQVGAAVEQQ